METSIFSVFSQNPETVSQSSSGGVFTELAKEIINQDGYVFGVALDSNFHAYHTCINTEEDLYKIRGSKYIPSNVGYAYREVVRLAKTNKVLFSGTSCQVAALNNFITDDIKDNVITCDFICHGVASEKVFDEYLKYICQGRKIISINFKDKTKGWENYGIRIKFENEEEYFNTFKDDPFMIGFIRNIYLKNSCYNCQFARLPRSSDLTLGDYWGVPKEIKNENGTSVVLCNTYKGEEFLKSLTGITIYPTTVENVSKGNPRLINGTLTKKAEYDNFYEDLNSMGFEAIIPKYLKPNNYERSIMFKLKQLIKRMFPKIYSQYVVKRYN